MGAPRKHHMPGKFRVEVDGFDSQNFAYAGPFDMEVGVSTVHVGPTLVPMNEPNGKVVPPEIELRRPMGQNLDLWNWFKTAIDAGTGRGEKVPALYKTVDFIQMDADDADLRKWRAYECFAFRYLGGEQDVDADNAKTEGVALKCSYCEPLNVES